MKAITFWIAVLAGQWALAAGASDALDKAAAIWRLAPSETAAAGAAPDTV